MYSILHKLKEGITNSLGVSQHSHYETSPVVEVTLPETCVDDSLNTIKIEELKNKNQVVALIFKLADSEPEAFCANMNDIWNSTKIAENIFYRNSSFGPTVNDPLVLVNITSVRYPNQNIVIYVPYIDILKMRHISGIVKYYKLSTDENSKITPSLSYYKISDKKTFETTIARIKPTNVGTGKSLEEIKLYILNTMSYVYKEIINDNLYCQRKNISEKIEEIAQIENPIKFIPINENIEMNTEMVDEFPNTCYDNILLGDEEIGDDDVVFMTENGKSYCYTKDSLKTLIDISPWSNIVYNCNGEGFTNVDEKHPYFQFNIGYMAYVPFEHIARVLESEHKYYMVKHTGQRFDHITSYGVLYQLTDIVSAYHCQDGTDIQVSELVKLVKV